LELSDEIDKESSITEKGAEVLPVCSILNRTTTQRGHHRTEKEASILRGKEDAPVIPFTLYLQTKML